MKNKKPSKRTILILLIFGLAIFLSRKSLFGNIANSQTAPTVSFEMQSSQGSETSTSVPLKVQLSASSTQTIKVDYQTTAGTASPIDEGTGQDYQPLRGTLTLNPGETEKNITLNIINDTINETDETIQITLSNPQNAIPGANSSYIYTITDDDRGILASVKDYGAKGDGTTDDTVAIQAAVDDVFQKGGGSTGKGGVLVFPEGTYMVTRVDIRDNITYEGYGATIKRPANQPQWTRTFSNAEKSNYLYSSSVDSKPLIIKGLTFDGNSQNQGAYQHYELEHSDLLFLMADRAKAGRVKVVVEDSYFKNSVSDGISVYNSVDITAYNCTAENDFRGGFTLTGGYTIAHVKNFTAGGKVDATGIDEEVDGLGYNNSYKADLYLENVYLMDGDLDLGPHENSGSTIEGKNIFSDAPVDFYGPGAVLRFSNSKFNVENSHVLFPSDASFDNCEFQVVEKEANEQDRTIWGIMPYLSSSYRLLQNGNLTFNNCRFTMGNSVETTDTAVAFYDDLDTIEQNNTIAFNGGSISSGFKRGISTYYYGGRWRIKNLNVAAETPFLWTGLKTQYGNTYMDISLDGVNVLGQKYFRAEGNDPNNLINQQNIQIDETANNLSFPWNSDISQNTYSGHRVILGTNPPTSSTHCLPGDIYRLKNPVLGQNYKWQCQTPAFNISSTAQWNAVSEPYLGSFSFSNTPANPTNNKSASINLSSSTLTLYKYKLDQDSYSNEIPISTTISLSNLSSGNHSLWVIGKNSQGAWQNDDDAIVYRWTIDPDPPAGLVRISNGNNLTDTNNVTLNFDSTDASNIARMRISNVPDFNTAQEYEYATSKAWTLNPGKGIQPVYAWFRDPLGNWTPAGSPHIDTIYSTFEGSPPAITTDLNSDNLVNQSDFDILKNVFLKLTANLANPKSDIDGDGQATIKDVGIMMSGWR